MSRIPWRIILVVEGPSDPPRIRMLVDHFLRKHAKEPVRVEDLRRFEQINDIDFRRNDFFVYVKEIPGIIRTLGLPRYSKFDHGDLGTLRRLQWILKAQSLLEGSVVIWSRDEDGDSVRRIDAEKAQKDGLFERLILALASECGEAWIVAGYRPTSKEDRDALERLKKKVGFDPSARPEALSHKDGGDVPRSAKQAVRDLFDGDIDRQDAALLIAVTSESQASIACGLAKFRDDLDAWLGSN
jgi:hypothetical protein